MDNTLPNAQTEQETDPMVNVLQREIENLKARLSEAERLIGLNRSNTSGPRVRIQNLEGVFKTTATVPSNSDDFQDGSILLYDDGSSTRRIYAKINKTWRFVALT